MCTFLAEAMLVPDLTSSLLSVRAVDGNRGAALFFGDARGIRSDGAAAPASGVLDMASVIGKVDDREQYVLNGLRIWRRRTRHTRALRGMQSFGISVSTTRGLKT